jgi:hypothetical protein
VPHGSVLAFGKDARLAEGGKRPGSRRQVGQWANVAKSQFLKCRETRILHGKDIAQRIRAGISPVGRIRHFSNADAVEDHQHYPVEECHRADAPGLKGHYISDKPMRERLNASMIDYKSRRLQTKKNH